MGDKRRMRRARFIVLSCFVPRNTISIYLRSRDTFELSLLPNIFDREGNIQKIEFDNVVDDDRFVRSDFPSLGIGSAVTGDVRKGGNRKRKSKQGNLKQSGKSSASFSSGSSKRNQGRRPKGQKGGRGKSSKESSSNRSPVPTEFQTPMPSSGTLSPSTAPSDESAVTRTPKPSFEPSELPSSFVIEAIPTSNPTPSVLFSEPPITRVPTSQPTSAPIRTRNYDIDLGFATTVASEGDKTIFRRARDQWERIIVGDLEDMSSDSFRTGEPFLFDGCEYPKVVDDLFICSSYAQVDGEGRILAFAGPLILRSSDGLPLTGRITFDSADVFDKARLESVAMHEMGHVVGIGTLWERRGITGSKAEGCPYFGASANAEYKKISGCDVIPIQQDSETCSHFDENCLDEELMTPSTVGTDLFSQLTVATVEDLGYEVDFSAALHTFGPADLGSAPQCTCNRRELSIVDRPHGQALLLQSRENSRPPKLNEEMRQKAITFGLSILKQSKQKAPIPTRKEGIIYVGDKIISVVVQQGDDVFDVLVKASDFQ